MLPAADEGDGLQGGAVPQGVWQVGEPVAGDVQRVELGAAADLIWEGGELVAGEGEGLQGVALADADGEGFQGEVAQVQLAGLGADGFGDAFFRLDVAGGWR